MPSPCASPPVAISGCTPVSPVLVPPFTPTYPVRLGALSAITRARQVTGLVGTVFLDCLTGQHWHSLPSAGRVTPLTSHLAGSRQRYWPSETGHVHVGGPGRGCPISPGKLTWGQLDSKAGPGGSYYLPVLQGTLAPGFHGNTPTRIMLPCPPEAWPEQGAKSALCPLPQRTVPAPLGDSRSVQGLYFSFCQVAHVPHHRGTFMGYEDVP